MERLREYLQERAAHLVSVRGKLNKETEVLEQLMTKLEDVNNLDEARAITSEYSEHLVRVKCGKLNGRSEELNRVVKKIDELKGDEQ
jgi:hypothetical protein